MRDLAIVLAVALALTFAVVALAGSNILTGHATVTQTPGAVGTNSGRALLEIEVDPDESSDVACGPMELPTATWWQIHAGSSKFFGVLYKGLFTAEKVIGCVTLSATPVTVHFAEEGGMPDRTSTATATATITNTPTQTPTATPTSP